MCLNTQTYDPKLNKAEEDIVVYKVLGIHVDGSLRAPFYPSYQYNLGEAVISKLVLREGATVQFVEEGLHSFASNEDLHEGFKQYLNSTQRLYSWAEYGTFKCRIPKGASYYVGVWDQGETAYASNELVVDERVN